MIDARLVMFRAGGERRDFPLNSPRTLIGRKNDCDVRIPLTEVSRHHTELLIKGDDVQGYREKTGLDKNSFFGDPKLVDPKNGDYRLAPDSPIRNLRPDGGPMGASF